MHELATTEPHLVNLPPELAAAIVAAQVAVAVVTRDGKNEHNGVVYSTADAIGRAAKSALNDAGAAWVRLDVGLDEARLGKADIGSQTYVGDVVERWMIVHKSGASLMGSSRIPVIVSKARPHEKAVAASLTYDSGSILRGALCMERESKEAVELRGDDGPREPPAESLCVGAAAPIAAANIDRCIELATMLGAKKGLDMSHDGNLEVWKKKVWVRACAHCKIPTDDGGPPGPKQLYISEGLRVKEFITIQLHAAKEGVEQDRQPGDDGDEDPRDVGDTQDLLDGAPF